MSIGIWGINLYNKSYFFQAKDKKNAKDVADKETTYSEMKANRKMYDKETIQETKQEMESLHELKTDTPYRQFISHLIDASRNNTIYVPDFRVHNNEFSKIIKELVLYEARDSFKGENGRIVYGFELQDIKDNLEKIKKIEKYEEAREKLIKILKMIENDEDMCTLV